jgi:glutathione S-transferase
MKLYEFGPTRAQRVRWTLQELGVEFEAESVNLNAGEARRPEFLALNPAGKLPVLVDGDQVLTESVAIALYLAEKYPHAGLLPTDLAQRAQAYRWLLFTTTELEQPLWRMARHGFLYPEEKRSPADIQLAREDFLSMVPIMDTHMRGRSYVVGGSVTITDFILAFTLDWADEEALLEDFPVLKTYMEAMYRRPRAVKRIAEVFAAMQVGRAAATA